MQETPSQKSGQVPNTCYKIVVRKFPINKLKKRGVNKLKANNILLLESWKHTHTPSPRA